MSDEPEITPDGGAELARRPGTGRRGAAAGGRDGDDSGDAASHRSLLLEVARREPVLAALRGGPASGPELAESVDRSRSTIHRATNALEEHQLITKTDGVYELTGLGRVVAEKVADFSTEVRTAVALEPFVNTVDMDTVPVEHFVDATVTRPTPRQPHTSIQRIIELIEEADRMRMLSTVLSPIYVDVGYREMRDGMPIEAVFDQEAIDIMVSKYTEKAAETIELGNFDVYAHERLPFELFIFDEKMGMAAHDADGIARVLVECESQSAIDWAEDLYDEHKSDAQSLGLSDL